jgi:hypothetical protein
MSVVILESNDTPAKKLLLTGGGRCNISHRGSIADFLPHYNEKHRFVKPAFFNFSNADLKHFFADKGLPLVDDGGRLFPGTMKSRDVLDVILDECKNLHVDIRCKSPVRLIRRDDTGFTVGAETGLVVTAPSLVIATGGISYPATGSTGDGFAFAKQFGHSIIDPSPALAPVYVGNYTFGACAGISLSAAAITLVRESKKIRSLTGDILFTHHGLSGPGILDMSRNIRPGDVIKISLVKFDDAGRLDTDLVRRISGQGSVPINKILRAYNIPERLVDNVLRSRGIPLNDNGSSIDRKRRAVIVKAFLELPFVIDQHGDFSEAMVTNGGVSVGEINPHTMQSRLCNNLYFAGEVIDVDGDSGGYNLQFAISSGMTAGKKAGTDII